MKKTLKVAILNSPDSDGDVFMPGAFKEMAKSAIVTVNFDRTKPVGFIESMQEDGDDVKVVANISEEILTHAQSAIEDKTHQIGFQVIKSEPNEHGGRNILELKLYECSLVIKSEKKDDDTSKRN